LSCEILEESRELSEYCEYETNQTVESIPTIVITTISSTMVKALFAIVYI